jgi:hypothetical protein
VDSLNRLRMFTAGVHIERGKSLIVRLSGAKFDADGTMSMASRSITTGEIDTRAVSATSMPLVAADTVRIRSLANKVLGLCVKT